MSRIVPNSMAAERERGCRFAETFRSEADVNRNNGEVIGTPTFDGDGVILDGASDYLVYRLTGSEFAGQLRSFNYEFWPDFDIDFDVNIYLFEADDSAGGNRSSIIKRNNAGGNVLRVVINSGLIADIPSATYGQYWNVSKKNVLQSVSQSGNTSVWLNGNKILDSDSTSWSSTDAVSRLTVGAAFNGAGKFDGKIGDFKVFKRVLTEQEILDLYNETTYDYPNRALVYLPMQAAQDDTSNLSGVELLVDGDMEAPDPSAWIVGGNANLTKDSTDPHSGNLCLRVAYNGTANPFAYQTVLISGNQYRVKGWAKGDGTFIPRVYSGGNIWVGTSSASWQYFDEIFTAPTTSISFYALATATGYCEFDDISVEQIVPRTLDVSGNDNHAILGDGVTPSTYPAKLPKRGYSFDGVADFLDLPIGAFPGESGSMFFMASDVLETNVRFAGTVDDRGGNYQLRTFFNTTTGYMQVFFPLGNALRNLSSSVLFNPKKTNTFCFTWERSGTDNVYRIYQDGFLCVTAQHTESAVVSPNQEFTLMRWSTGYTQGNMHSAFVSQQVLTPMQVADLHINMIKSINRV